MEQLFKILLLLCILGRAEAEIASSQNIIGVFTTPATGIRVPYFQNTPSPTSNPDSTMLTLTALDGRYTRPSQLATVATSGAYSDLSGKPTIPTNNNQLTNGSGYITGISGSDVTTALGYTPYNSTNPSGYISSVPAQSFASLTGKPTTLSGYGITDAYPLSGNPSGFLTNVTAGYAISVSGTTNKTVAVDTANLMTISAATTAIDTMNTKINGKVAQSTVLTIGGVAQNLSANRTWLANTDALTEGSTNLYYTNTRSRGAISLTTTGSSGAANYNSSTGVLNVPQYANSGGTVTSVGVSSSTLNVSGSPVTTSGNITVNIPTVTFNPTPSRSLSTTGSNNTFTISTTRNARVTYTINFSFALTLITSNGLVSLDYSLDGGSNWITVASVSNAYTVAVTLTGNADNCLSGEIPANALVRIYRSSSTNVTVTAPTSKQQEVLY